MTRERGKLLSILIYLRLFIILYPIIFLPILGIERLNQIFDFRNFYESFLSMKGPVEIICLISILMWKRFAVFILLFLDLATLIATSIIVYADQPVKLTLNLAMGAIIIGVWNYSIYRKRRLLT